MNIRYGVKLFSNFNKMSKQTFNAKQMFNQSKFQAVTVKPAMETGLTFVKGSVAPALTIATILNGMRANAGCFGIDDSQDDEGKPRMQNQFEINIKQ